MFRFFFFSAFEISRFFLFDKPLGNKAIFDPLGCFTSRIEETEERASFNVFVGVASSDLLVCLTSLLC